MPNSKIDANTYLQYFKKDCEVNGFVYHGVWKTLKYRISPPPIYLYIKLLRKIECIGRKSRLCIIDRFKLSLYYRKYRRLGLKLSFEVYPYTCGPGLRLLHAGGIIINPNARIGENFTIRSFSVIGNKKTGDSSSVPKIGNNVEVGCNCSIIGKITIGNNVCIGAGSVVISDIPDNSICVGNPARVVKKIHNAATNKS